ncbi:MAG TPA: Gfo/Idh/MocA family oxidoreductase [Verrucomicrobiota bacterium]|nr:Gfo/Idh/MocA family oxidoreductase [Verrucomicrobiota bacterium]HRZ34736.1 Gfo/Idh/MocA family oxidoreductase [Candidatus Paceibacterota bacterium]HRZ54408.1 Gfo/Idh/MocA family oxidoreductase [Candidatus Paceibacterota bacterium]
MNRVRMAVIGLGWFGEKHCEALSGIPHVELHALCTRTESRLKALARTFGVRKTYTDYRALLADPDVDAVSVVTMWDQHAAPTLAALDAGKHVFLEKPMASTNADCERIVRAAKAASKHFMVGHICRFNPRYAAAKEAIAAGKIGRIVSMYARRNIPACVGQSVLPKIGPIIGDGVHDTDLMLWYSGAKVVSAYAQTVNVRKLKNPDLGWTMYRFDTGAIGVLEDTWFLPDTTAFQIDERMEIIGTEGSIHIHETHPNLSICDATGWHSPDTTYWPSLHGVRAGALRDELSYFLQCVLEDRKPTVITPEESAAAVRACLAAEASAATGRIVKLK